jgi:hypothetical protein
MATPSARRSSTRSSRSCPATGLNIPLFTFISNEARASAVAAWMVVFIGLSVSGAHRRALGSPRVQPMWCTPRGADARRWKRTSGRAGHDWSHQAGALQRALRRDLRPRCRLEGRGSTRDADHAAAKMDGAGTNRRGTLPALKWSETRRTVCRRNGALGAARWVKRATASYSPGGPRTVTRQEPALRAARLTPSSGR